MCIRGGTYRQTIRPSKSGDPEQGYITYTRYNQEVITLKNVNFGIDLSNKNYVRIDGIDVDGENIGSSANVRYWVYLDGGSYNVVQNCDFKRAQGWGCVRMKNNAHHNQVLNNTMQYCGSYDRDNGDMIEVWIGHYNVIEENIASYGGHNILMLDGHYNVVRNNDFSNPWERVIEARNYDSDGRRNLIESNISYVIPAAATDNPIPPLFKLDGEEMREC